MIVLVFLNDGLNGINWEKRKIKDQLEFLHLKLETICDSFRIDCQNKRRRRLSLNFTN